MNEGLGLMVSIFQGKQRNKNNVHTQREKNKIKTE